MTTYANLCNKPLLLYIQGNGWEVHQKTHSRMSIAALSQFNSVTQLCPTLCDPMNCSMPGFLVHHQLLELTQTHVH